ncbi:MAG: hypothetical protein LRY40_03510, partial [Shewanella fodinae]|nr:hypothetical protein [Shewanella fodinae]
GDDREQWKQYDAVELIKSGAALLPMKVDQGESDPFLAEQLLPETLISAAKQMQFDLDYQLHAGYDHSYYFIASFIETHLRFISSTFNNHYSNVYKTIPMLLTQYFLSEQHWCYLF